jgi:hypothetical protein
MPKRPSASTVLATGAASLAVQFGLGAAFALLLVGATASGSGSRQILVEVVGFSTVAFVAGYGASRVAAARVDAAPVTAARVDATPVTAARVGARRQAVHARPSMTPVAAALAGPALYAALVLVMRPGAAGPGWLAAEAAGPLVLGLAGTLVPGGGH